MGSLFSPSKQTSTNESSGTSTTSGERTGRQTNVFKEVLDRLLAQINAGPQVMQSDRNAMRTGINTKYNAVAPQVESGLTSRGFGDSGKLGAAFKGLNLARAGDIQTGEADLRGQAQERFAHLLALAYPFTRPDENTTTFSQSGNQTQPGPSIFDRILGTAGQAAGIGLALGAGA